MLPISWIEWWSHRPLWVSGGPSAEWKLGSWNKASKLLTSQQKLVDSNTSDCHPQQSTKRSKDPSTQTQPNRLPEPSRLEAGSKMRPHHCDVMGFCPSSWHRAPETFLMSWVMRGWGATLVLIVGLWPQRLTWGSWDSYTPGWWERLLFLWGDPWWAPFTRD